MLILFDHGAPRGLARAFAGHTVVTARARDWDRLSNGALLKAAEAAGIDLLLTTDQRIRYQQNPLVSGYKSNRINWLPESPKSFSKSDA
jgi:hypothetical protein